MTAPRKKRYPKLHNATSKPQRSRREVQVSIKIQLLHHGCLPEYQTPGAAAMDLRASIRNPVVLKPHTATVVPSGIAIALPSGFCAEIHSRSSLASNHLVVVVNAPGIIDSDYRGEVLICLANLGKRAFRIMPLDRVAQILVRRVSHVRWVRVQRLSATQRGHGNLGHTGRR